MLLNRKLSTKTIMLIDDDDDDREIFETALTKTDPTFQFISVARAEEGLRLLIKELIVPPDMIFLDLNMPGMNGKECLIELRKLKILDLTAIIIYSTCPMVDELRLLGATDFLVKPNSYRDLQKALKSVLNKMHARQIPANQD